MEKKAFIKQLKSGKPFNSDIVDVEYKNEYGNHKDPYYTSDYAVKVVKNMIDTANKLKEKGAIKSEFSGSINPADIKIKFISFKNHKWASAYFSWSRKTINFNINDFIEPEKSDMFFVSADFGLVDFKTNLDLFTPIIAHEVAHIFIAKHSKEHYDLSNLLAGKTFIYKNYEDYAQDNSLL